MKKSTYYYVCRLEQIKEEQEFDGTYSINTSIQFEIVSDPCESIAEANAILDDILEKKMSDYEYDMMKTCNDSKELEIRIDAYSMILGYMYRVLSF